MALMQILRSVAEGIPGARETMEKSQHLRDMEQLHRQRQMQMQQQQEVNPLNLKLLNEKLEYQPQLWQSKIDQAHAQNQLSQSKAKTEPLLAQLKLEQMQEKQGQPLSTVGKETYDLSRMKDPRKRDLALAMMQSNAEKPKIAGIREDGTPIMSEPNTANLRNIWLGMQGQDGQQEQPQQQSQQETEAPSEPDKSMTGVRYKDIPKNTYIPSEISKHKGQVYTDPKTGKVIDSMDAHNVQDINQFFRYKDIILPLIDRLQKIQKGNHLRGFAWTDWDKRNLFNQELNNAKDDVAGLKNFNPTRYGLGTAEDMLGLKHGDSSQGYTNRTEQLKKDILDKEKHYQKLLAQGYRYSLEPNHDISEQHYKEQMNKPGLELGGKSFSDKQVQAGAQAHNMTVEQYKSALIHAWHEKHNPTKR